jgi:flagellar FliL protein
VRIFQNNSGKLPKIVLIILAVAIVGGLGVVSLTKMGKHGKGKPEKKIELSTMKLDEFVVNLADRDESHYLKVNLVLEVEGKPKEGGEKEGEGAEESPEVAKIRDTVITTLTTRKYNDLLSDKGKTKLKNEMKQELGKSVEGLKVANIYFTSFAMQ